MTPLNPALKDSFLAIKFIWQTCKEWLIDTPAETKKPEHLLHLSNNSPFTIFTKLVVNCVCLLNEALCQKINVTLKGFNLSKHSDIGWLEKCIAPLQDLSQSTTTPR